MLEQLDVLEGARDAQRRDRVRRLRDQVLAVEADAAGGRRVDAADQVEHRRLAGAVGADQREDLAALHVEADVVDRQHAAEAHASGGWRGAMRRRHFSRSDFWNDFCRLNMPLAVEREDLQVGADLEPAAVQAHAARTARRRSAPRRRPPPAGPAPGRSTRAGSPCPCAISCGIVIRKIAPRKAPCTEPRPPMTTISSRSIDCRMLNCSGDEELDLVRVQRAAQPGQRRRERERQRLVARQVDAHALRRDLRVADRDEGAPGGRAQQVQDGQRCASTAMARHRK